MKIITFIVIALLSCNICLAQAPINNNTYCKYIGHPTMDRPYSYECYIPVVPLIPNPNEMKVFNDEKNKKNNGISEKTKENMRQTFEAMGKM